MQKYLVNLCHFQYLVLIRLKEAVNLDPLMEEADTILFFTAYITDTFESQLWIRILRGTKFIFQDPRSLFKSLSRLQ